MSRPQLPFEVQVFEKKTKLPYTQHFVSGEVVIVSKPLDEFYLEVSARPEDIERCMLSDPNADYVTVYVSVDGNNVGVSERLTMLYPIAIFKYYVDESMMKKALVFVEPSVVAYQDESEAKQNVERNKDSPAGQITVRVVLSKATPLGNFAPSAVSTTHVLDTKKPFDRPDLGIGLGADLGPMLYSTGSPIDLAGLGKKALRAMSQTMLAYLKTKNGDIPAAATPQDIDAIPAWSCPRCTLINTAKNCAACGESPPINLKRKSEVVDLT